MTPEMWSYTKLVQSIDSHKVLQGAIYPDASIRALDVDNVLH